MCQLQENEEANPMTFSMSTYHTHMNEISIHRKNMGLAFSYFLAIYTCPILLGNIFNDYIVKNENQDTIFSE